MKFVIYKGQNKFTIDNVFVPNAQEMEELFQEAKHTTMSMNEFDLCNFQITSSRGLTSDEYFPMEEMELGGEEINWHRETVN